MKTDSQRWGEVKTEKLIELVKIHRYEKCDEFSSPLMDEVIKRLVELEERVSYDSAIHKKLEKYNKIIQIVAE